MLVLTLGLDAEHSWLPALAAEARNARIMEDREGLIEVCDGVEFLDVPGVISRAEGDQHAEGNPHINVGPQNGRLMAENIAYALMEFDPEGTDDYDANLTTQRVLRHACDIDTIYRNCAAFEIVKS